MRRVVVTGLGAVTPIGLNTDDFWDAIKKNTVGIDTITSFDSSGYKAHLAAEVKGFNAADCMDFKASRRMEKFSQYAVAAAFEALKDSGLNIENEDAYMAGVSVGSGIGSLSAMENSHKKLLEKGPSRINPLLVPMMITNMAAGNVSIQLGLKGKSINVVTACATGTNSIGEAYRSIQHGEADIMFAGGTESAVTPIGIGGFAALTALSESTDPLKASLPFDKNRNGFVMGEGAGVVVLEELEHALKRNARIYAEVAGYGCTSDAYHITSPMEDGSAAAEAGLKKGDVITAINGKKVQKMAELQENISLHKPGDKVQISYLREKKSYTKSITLKNAQGTTSVVKEVDIDEMGVSLTPLSDELKQQLDLGYGLEVSAIRSGAMQKAGITKGLIILQVNDKQMRTRSDFDEAVKNANMSSDRTLWIRAITKSGIKKSFTVDLGSKDEKPGKK